MSDKITTIISFRDPKPPHGSYCTVLAPVRYGFKIRKTSTATFLLARSDPNIPQFLGRIVPNEPAMVSIERTDGMLPWVGFVTRYESRMADPYARFTCADHSWRLASPHGARTTKSAVYPSTATPPSTSSGSIIRNLFKELEDRAEPSPYLLYDNIEDGPPAAYVVRADYALDVLEGLAKATNYEWGFSYSISPESVNTYLNWVRLQGTDRRDEEAWSEQKHFTAAAYSLNYANGISSALVVGGGPAGNFAARPAAQANITGRATDAAGVQAFPKNPVSPFGLRGTRIATTQRILDINVIKQQAIQMHEAPEYAVEQLSFTVAEAAIDMSRLNLGDIRLVRLQTTSLGSAIERVIRIIAIGLNPATGEHDIEAQVLPA